MYYTGIGSRETPSEVLGIMEDAAFRLATLGWVLRSGKAGGADAAFQLGLQKYCYVNGLSEGDVLGKAEIYTPWGSFGTPGLFDWWDINLEFINKMMPDQISERDSLLEGIHPNYNALRAKRGAFALHSRNMHQVLGVDILNPRPSKFCLYYAKEDKAGNPMGGTATAVNLSKKYGVRTLNLNTPERLEVLEGFLSLMEKKNGIEIQKKT